MTKFIFEKKRKILRQQVAGLWLLLSLALSPSHVRSGGAAANRLPLQNLMPGFTSRLGHALFSADCFVVINLLVADGLKHLPDFFILSLPYPPTILTSLILMSVSDCGGSEYIFS